MADNYTQFSEQLPLETDEQRDWVRNKKYLALRLLRELKITDEQGRTMTPEELEEACYDSSYCCVGFQSEVEAHGWWIYSDEYGDPGAAAEAVQDFMQTFDINEPFIINWACTCSKPRLGEFYGGAVIVRKDSIEYINASDIAQAKVNE